PVGETWPLQGTIQNLARSKSIVTVGLDAWDDLPVLALWMRRAVQRGAKLVVIGERNGLWRDTTAWLRGAPAAAVDALLDSLRAGAAPSSAPEVAAAVSALNGQAPASLLVHPSLVASNRSRFEALAAALGADGQTGLVGAPLLGANARGAADLAPDLLRGDPERVLAARALLVLGDEAWAELKTGSFAHLVVATSQAVAEDDPRVDVVLPMAHAYERQGTITNLEGRLQHQEGGAAPPPHARADWGIAAGLAQRLGAPGPAPTSLEVIRSLIADEHPALAAIIREEALIARV
ncbi:MAG TPA: molybdopterin-dependent oxidoreductase, partial [Chloroflexota bacterium]